MTHGRLCREAEQQLAAAGISGAGVEARAMLCAALCAKYDDYYRLCEHTASPETAQSYRQMIQRRLLGCPAAYICGTWEFFGLELYVTESVLIPRSDTETLVEQALHLAEGRRGLKLLDLCCGSGCIGIAVAKNLPEATLTLSDISEEALTVAKKNARMHLAEGSFETELRDARSDRAPEPKYDLVFCNPPYVTELEWRELDVSVRDYEPRLALVGEEEGLEFYRRVPSAVRPALEPEGWLLFECGAGQAADVAGILAGDGWQDIRCIQDPAGIDRVVCARMPQD
ncbi:MAG: peptide chain release factor N(5)-glutamine methyltransferase [Clostridia bacterium]|nr:peptide chain release factor N(5)-glutamine methyltransferase [Clostridia bacterium]